MWFFEVADDALDFRVPALGKGDSVLAQEEDGPVGSVGEEHGKVDEKAGDNQNAHIGDPRAGRRGIQRNDQGGGGAPHESVEQHQELPLNALGNVRLVVGVP